MKAMRVACLMSVLALGLGACAGAPVEQSGQPQDPNAFTREAVQFIERCGSERPFFLYLAYNAVHSPLQGDDAYMEKYSGIEDIQRRIFAAMLGQLDDGVGAVIDAVEKQGILNNTLIVFFSDNGGPTRELTSSNLPLRGEKGRLFEGGIRVPFLLQLPSQIEGGQVYEKPVTSLDLFPTSLALAGIPVEQQTDGVDLLPFLTGANANDPHENLFWRVGPQGALRKGDWKLVRERKGRQPGPWMLFDLENDIGETRDLAAEKPEKLRELIQDWEKYDGEMIDPVF